eukprot:snap_masked-scaffold_13-processed-gene-7.28-mRNA-1 protein AED:1.00 eAED:1.00 QI:0/0/0/0/1/1/2/0/438
MTRFRADVPIRKYVEEEVHDQGKRLHLLVLMEKIDMKKYDTKQNRRRNINIQRIQVKFTKLGYIDRSPEGNTLGWYPEEKLVLEALLLKYGCGCYVDYLKANALHFRSKQQIATQLQRLLNLQAIGIFHGLKFKLEDARRFLSKHFGINHFHKNIPGSFNTLLEKEHILQLFRQEVTLFDGSSIAVPYFRRLDDLRHLRLLLQEFELPEAKRFLADHNIYSLQEIQDSIKSFNEDIHETIFDNEELLDHLNRFLFLNKEIWITLSSLYSILTLPFEEDISQIDSESLQTRFKHYSNSLVISLHSDSVKLVYLEVETQKKIILKYLGGNIFLIDGSEATVHFEPPCKQIYITNIFDLQFYKPKSKNSIFQVAVMDPPWSVGSKNPTRGVALKYPTLSLLEFQKIKLSLSHFPFGSHLYVWVTNYSYQCVLNWAAEQQYY